MSGLGTVGAADISRAFGVANGADTGWGVARFCAVSGAGAGWGVARFCAKFSGGVGMTGA